MARECTGTRLLRYNECYLKNCEQCHVANNELEHFLLSPEDTVAGNACDERGRKKERGIEVAEIRRFFAALPPEKPRQKLQGVAGSHRVHECAVKQAFGDHGAQAKIDVRNFG